MALCILTKVFTIKAFEAGLIFATFFFIPVISAPTSSTAMGTIEARLRNPCGYREKLRHSRSAKEKQVEEQFKLFKYEFNNVTQPKIDELYTVKVNLDSLKFPTRMPTNAFKNKKKNYESLQIYAKAFDTLSNQDNDVAVAGNFTLEARKNIFDALSNSSIRLLCVMYDEDKKLQRNTKLKPKVIDFDKHLKAPVDFTSLYSQDLLVLGHFKKFFKKLGNVIPYPKKNKKKKKNQKLGLHTTERSAKKSITPKNTNANKKNALLKNKRKSLKAAS